LSCSDCCALSLQPFQNPVAAITEGKDGTPTRADVFDLVNIVPYIRKYHTSAFFRALRFTFLPPVRKREGEEKKKKNGF
jgi:hypothetical protein